MESAANTEPLRGACPRNPGCPLGLAQRAGGEAVREDVGKVASHEGALRPVGEPLVFTECEEPSLAVYKGLTSDSNIERAPCYSG